MGANGIVRRVDGIGERSVNGTLAGLLSLTSDAVIAFDGFGKVLLSNAEAERLFAGPAEGLLGCDVRMLFPPAVGVVPDAPFSLESLPFSCDGSSATLTCQGADGMPVTLTLRCSRVSSPGDTLLLVAHHTVGEQQAQREHDRLVEELSRANNRLSGTLKIVLDTLDSKDVTTLFSRVLEEITETMEAFGTVFYVAADDGYHLRGTSSSLVGADVARYMPQGRMIERLATQAGRSLRLRVLAPQGDALRQGRLARREVVNEETREVYGISSRVLPPFVSFIAVPVWFGSHVVALIEVGWKQVHPTRGDDAELLDAVARYLSVQLVGAFSTMRAQHEQRLGEAAAVIRGHLMGEGGLERDGLRLAAVEAAGELDATLVPMRAAGDGHYVAELPDRGPVSLGGDLERDLEGLLADVPVERGAAPSVGVHVLGTGSPLASWLREMGEPCIGALVDVGVIAGERRMGMILRHIDAEPLDDLELSFLSRVAQGARELSLGDEERRQDKRISQALQTGMRNELQRVPGISARGIYSSATQAAVIGGDFYDLIRLPHHHACVIMGDVSGKGVEAASVSAAVKTALGAYSWQGLSPARMVRLLNDFLLGFSRLETFATLFVGIVDLSAGTLTYCSAGHPPALLVRSAAGAGCDVSGEIETLDVQSGVVGAFHEMSYQNGRVRLSRGDMLLLYTDGTTEARAKDGAFFGEDGLRDAVMREAPRGFDGILDRLLETLDRFTDRRLEDDVAMVCLRFDDVGAPLPAAAVPPRR